MRHSLFIEFVNGQLAQVKSLLSSKLIEYTNDEDALATYRKAADYIGNVLPEDVVLSRIAEKMERLRNDKEHNKELSKDALLDIIGHVLFVLAFQYERKSLTYGNLYETIHKSDREDKPMAPAHHL
jgi:hypothetical protein